MFDEPVDFTSPKYYGAKPDRFEYIASGTERQIECRKWRLNFNCAGYNAGGRAEISRSREKSVIYASGNLVSFRSDQKRSL